MKYYSALLNRTFEVSDEKKIEKPKTIEVFHQIRKELGLSIRPEGLPKDWNCIQQITIPVILKDKDGYEMTAIGEACIDTLETIEEKTMPATIAYNNGFDKVLGMYLDLDEVKEIQPEKVEEVVEEKNTEKEESVPTTMEPVMPVAPIAPTAPIAPNITEACIEPTNSISTENNMPAFAAATNISAVSDNAPFSMPSMPTMPTMNAPVPTDTNCQEFSQPVINMPEMLSNAENNITTFDVSQTMEPSTETPLEINGFSDTTILPPIEEEADAYIDPMSVMPSQTTAHDPSQTIITIGPGAYEPEPHTIGTVQRSSLDWILQNISEESIFAPIKHDVQAFLSKED